MSASCHRGLQQVFAVAFAYFLCLMVLYADESAVRGEDFVTEYQVKAAYLYKFGSYVEWPHDPSAGADGPFTIAVMGADELADYLAKLVSGRSIDGRPIEVHALRDGPAPADVHVLFIGRSVEDDVLSILAGVRGKAVLIVTESDNSETSGGVINFVVVDNRVRFDVELTSAGERKLKISARLLNVARRVFEQPS